MNLLRFDFQNSREVLFAVPESARRKSHLRVNKCIRKANVFDPVEWAEQRIYWSLELQAVGEESRG